MTMMIGILADVVGIAAGLIAIWLGAKVLRGDDTDTKSDESKKSENNRNDTHSSGSNDGDE